MSLGKVRELGMDREAWHAAVHEVTKSQTRLSDWTELQYIVFTTFLVLPISEDDLIAAYCQGLLYADMGYLLKRKNQEGRELQAKKLNPSGRLKETVGEGKSLEKVEFWPFRRANRELGGEGNAVIHEYWECLPGSLQHGHSSLLSVKILQ